MRGWLRYFALNAQVRTGVSAAVLTWAIIAAAAAAGAAVFLVIALFVWIAQHYGALIAAVALGCTFVLVALIALAVCLIARRRNMERARVELAARGSNWLDPRLLTVGVQLAQQIGWRRIVSLVGVALLAGGLAREWSARGAADEEENEGDAAPEA
jgi:predicted lysophospholipase L1 biosynthesis ABC-type transport system permease subunit